jgi:hypothetical protein
MRNKLLTSDFVKELHAVSTRPCISLYMPTHQSHPENVQDPIRFKNLVKKINETLSEQYSSEEISALIKPFAELAEDRDFWNHTSAGLAVLCTSEFFEVINLPITVNELTIVADSFHTRPLRRYLQSADRYHVLKLNQHEYHLFEGNRHSLFEVIIPVDVPRTIEEALGYELTDSHTTVASYGGVSGESANMHHGHGGKKDEVDIDAEKYFRVVADIIEVNFSTPSGLPLILAALSEHHNRFQAVNKNALLLTKGINLNTQAVSKDKLAQLAWKVMEPVYLLKLSDWLSEFSQAKANDLGIEIIDEVIEAAEAGRVRILFIEEGRIMTKRIRNKITGTYEMMDLTQPKLDDLLDDIAEQVSIMGGKVIIIPADKMPSKTGVAAVLRY